MLDLLWRACFRWRLRPRQVTGDTTYGTVENVKAVEEFGIRAYVPLPDFGKRTPFFGKTEFLYDVERDVYVCPQGEDLRRRTLVRNDRVVRYRADAAVCNSCSLKDRCTKSSEGRQVSRAFDEAYLDRVRAYHDGDPYQKAIRKRGVWVEPLFAEGKQWHGMGRFRLRGLEKVNVEALLLASGQNVKRLLGFGRRGPKAPARVDALHPPAATSRRIHCARGYRAGGTWRSNEGFRNSPACYQQSPETQCHQNAAALFSGTFRSRNTRRPGRQVGPSFRRYSCRVGRGRRRASVPRRRRWRASRGRG